MAVPVVVDLRSDTVTRPTAEMRRAMADADVGDDGYGEDPTVRRLEAAYAERVGKEAAVFVPSGTMANQIALRLLGRPGTAVVIGRRQHPVAFELGASGINGQYQFVTVADTDGTLDPAEVAWLVGAEAHHWLPVSAVCVEDTHMPAGGVPWPLARLAEVAAAGRPLHLDGARLFNAAVATGDDPAAIARVATTVMSCLSKGLGAPVGSVLAGPAELMARARVERKRLGGAMRQAGIVAAAGLIALEHHVARLADDHARAAALAAACRQRWPGAEVRDGGTNCVVAVVPDDAGLLAHLAAAGVAAGTIGPGEVRFMTHLDVTDDGLDTALAAIRSAP